MPLVGATVILTSIFSVVRPTLRSSCDRIPHFYATTLFGHRGALHHRRQRASLAPQTLRLIRLATECRRSKSLRNLANPLDSHHLIGSPPPPPQDRPAPPQTWSWTPVLKVRSIPRHPAIDGANFVAVAGANNGRGSHIALRSIMDQRSDLLPGASTPIPGRGGVTTRGRIPPQLMGPMLMILAELYEQ